MLSELNLRKYSLRSGELYETLFDSRHFRRRDHGKLYAALNLHDAKEPGVEAEREPYQS